MGFDYGDWGFSRASKEKGYAKELKVRMRTGIDIKWDLIKDYGYGFFLEGV